MQTPICEDAGRFPVWEKTFEPAFPVISHSDEMLIECYDQDRSRTNLIGDTRIKVGTICFSYMKKFWFTLTDKGRDSVELLIEAKMFPV